MPDARPGPAAPPSAEPPVAGSGLRLLASWGLVGIPLAWGVYQTVVKSMALFE